MGLNPTGVTLYSENFYYRRYWQQDFLHENIGIENTFFSNDASAILSGISQAKSGITPKYSYTVGGVRSIGSSKGLLIQKMNDGTTRKVVIR